MTEPSSPSPKREAFRPGFARNWQRVVSVGTAIQQRLPRVRGRPLRVSIERLRRGPLLALLVFLMAGLALSGWVAFNTYVLVPHTRPWEFGLAWAGLRAWLFYGASPYDGQRAQTLLTWIPGEPSRITLPAFPWLLLYLPFALIPHGPLAYGLWLTLQQAAMAWLAVGMGRSLFQRSPRAWMLFVLLGWLWPGTWLAWHQGAADALALPGIVLAWIAFRDERDGPAGWLWLPALWIIDRAAWALVGWGMWSLSRKRRRGPVTWMVGVAVLAATAYWLHPGWLMEYMRMSPGGGVFPAIREALPRLFPGLGPRVALSLAGLALVSLVVHWGKAWIHGPDYAFWTGMWTLTLGPLLGLRWNAALLFWLWPGLLFTFATWMQGWRYGPTAVLIIGGLLWPLAWLGVLLLPPPQVAALTLVVGVPLTLLLLSWCRWWYLRPLPRLWV